MMITYVKGSLFESPAKVLVNTVNTVGVMGKGLARTFKEIYPEMFCQYQQLCERKQFPVGKLWVYKTPHKWILNFPTKVHWRQPSEPEYVEEGLKTFVSTYAAQGFTSVAFPRLGCGNGELDWENVVRPIMTKYLGKLAIDIFVYEFGEDYGPPEHRDIAAMTTWLRSEPRALAFSEMWADLCNLIGSGLTLRTWDDVSEFRVSVTTNPTDGFLIEMNAKSLWDRMATMFNKIVHRNRQPTVLGPGTIFVPQEAMLDLWQNVRAYGFCVPSIMPEGLDVLSSHVLAIMARLDYMKPVEISQYTPQKPIVGETALRLFAAPSSPLPRLSQSVYMVHPV